MSEHTYAFNRRSIAAAGISAILAAGLMLPISTANATPASSKQAEADAALVKLNEYNAQLDQASADYQNALQEQLDAQARVEEAEVQIAESTQKIEQGQAQLSERARAMYRSGGNNFLDVILGATSFEEFATNWGMLETLNENDAQLVAETKQARETLETAKAEAVEQEQVAANKASEAKAVADAADAAAAEMQATYNSLSSEAQELIAQEQAAQEAAQAAAAQAAIAAENSGGGNGNAAASGNGNAAASNSNNSSNNNGNSSSSSSSKKSGGSSANNSKSQTVSGNVVVDRAYSQLGKPYSWGAVGPSSYDCSGLVSYCLTGRNTRLGTTGTFMGWTRVTNPKPGDICVNSHHTGIYIGGGQMIHAPRTGDVVKVSSVHSDMIYVRY